MKKRLIIIHGLIWLVVAATNSFSDEDPFEEVKEDFRQAPCVQIEFRAILESQVFDQVDTGSGIIHFAADGRYLLETGVDTYLFDGTRMYSYSGANNQVVVETPDSGSASPYELSLLRRLDELYETHIIRPSREYRLRRLSERKTELPDSMTVFLDAETGSLKRMEYFDLNDDLNRIVIDSYKSFPECPPERFEPDFPQTADVIEL